jgi:hypothetical protein
MKAFGILGAACAALIVAGCRTSTTDSDGMMSGKDGGSCSATAEKSGCPMKAAAAKGDCGSGETASTKKEGCCASEAKATETKKFGCCASEAKATEAKAGACTEGKAVKASCCEGKEVSAMCTACKKSGKAGACETEKKCDSEKKCDDGSKP